ncbi:MAG: YceI family protein [Thermomicrobiales bacterium]
MFRRTERPRAWLAWPLAALSVPCAVALLLAGSPSHNAVAQDQTNATPSGEIGKAVLAEPPDGSTLFTIVSDESSAGYTVEEELAGVGDTEAVGTTNAIIGEIVIGPDGDPLAGSRLDIDLRTLTSDETRRDNYLRRDSLESDTYPLATFVVTGVEDWTGPLEDGETVEFSLVGDLTVHGVTKEVTWETTATLEDGDITGAATTSVEMPDFEIEKPRVAMVLGVDETVQLDLTITATPAE